MQTRKLALMTLILLLSIISNPLLANSSADVSKAMALKDNKHSKKDLIGSWKMDLPRSLIKLDNIFYEQELEKGVAKSVMSIEKVTADYLYYEDAKDELYYSVKVEDLVYVYEMSSKKKEEVKKERNIWMELSLPIDNVFKEILITNIEALVVQSDKIIPINLERLMINNFTVFPKEDSRLKKASFDFKGKIFDGLIDAIGVVRPFVSPAPVSLNLKIKNLSIEKLNPWLKQAASLSVEKGTVDVFVEFAAKEGKLKGYVKFFTQDLELMNEWKDNTSFFNNLKKSVYNFGINLMERTEEDIISGKIKFEGDADSIDIEYSTLFSTLIEHIFDGPLKRKYDKQVKLKDL